MMQRQTDTCCSKRHYLSLWEGWNRRRWETWSKRCDFEDRHSTPKDHQSTDTRNRVTCELPVSGGLWSRSEDDGQACAGGLIDQMAREPLVLRVKNHKRCGSVLRVCQSLSHVRLCNPMGCSPVGSSVHRVLHAKLLEWVAISFLRGSSLSKDWNLGLQHCRQILYCLSHQGSPQSAIGET